MMMCSVSMQAINAEAEIIPTTNSSVDLNKIINIQGFSLEKVLQMDPNFLDVSHPAQCMHDGNLPLLNTCMLS